MRIGVQGLLSTGVAQPLLHHDHRAPDAISRLA
jgi:hypothetical protein